MIHFPTRCPACQAPLTLHCYAANSCTWLRCGNARCHLSLFDVERGVVLNRDGIPCPLDA